MPSPVIAIDGPAASGKGTLCRLLASHYRLDRLDTGLLYRASAQQCLEGGIDLDNADAVAAFLRQVSVIDITRSDLRTEAVGKIASKIATYPALRQVLFDYQQNFAQNPPHGRGAVLDGRDIGTHIVPETPYKFFLIASAEVRAQRRFDELRPIDPNADFQAILQAIKTRDHQDAHRSTAPLKPAEDACIIDTSDLEANRVFAIVQEKLSERGFVID